MEVQTRNQDGELKYFTDAKEAFEYARSNLDVWKISFGGVRLVRMGSIDVWKYEPMDDILDEAMKGGK